MLRILLVKTSSLGDVVHNFPVVSDLRRHFPDAAIEWVVEEAYAPLVRLQDPPAHPGCEPEVVGVHDETPSDQAPVRHELSTLRKYVRISSLTSDWAPKPSATPT